MNVEVLELGKINSHINLKSIETLLRFLVALTLSNVVLASFATASETYDVSQINEAVDQDGTYSIRWSSNLPRFRGIYESRNGGDKQLVSSSSNGTVLSKSLSLKIHLILMGRLTLQEGAG